MRVKSKRPKAHMDRSGRSKGESHIRLHRGVYGSAAWKSLSCEARCALIEVWQRHDGFNNGRIGCSHREIRGALRIGSRKVTQALKELQERGFLIIRTKGAFDFKVGAGEGRSTEWEITTEPCDDQPAKRLYKNWSEKQNTGTTVVTAGNHSSCRSPKKTPRKVPSGNHSSCRYGPKDHPSGNHSGDTFIIPGGEASEDGDDEAVATVVEFPQREGVQS